MSSILGKRKNEEVVSFSPLKRISVEKSLLDSTAYNNSLDWLRSKNFKVSCLLKHFNSKIINDHPLSGSCYTDIGYALINSRKACFILSYRQSLGTAEPPTITFPLPEEDSNGFSGQNALTAFVPSDASDKEPGLLIVMPISGRIAYWTSIGNALAQSYICPQGMESLIKLLPKEKCEHLCCSNPMKFIISTNFGRLFSVQLRDPAGQPDVSVQLFASDISTFSTILQKMKIFNYPSIHIIALKSPPLFSPYQHLLYVAEASGLLEIYDLKLENKLVSGMNLSPIFKQVLREGCPDASGLEVLDLTICPTNGNLVSFLVCWKNSINYRYMIISLDFSDISSPSVMNIHPLYSFSSKSLESSKLHYSSSGNSLFVVLTDAVIIVHVQEDDKDIVSRTSWEEVIRMNTNVSGGIFMSTCYKYVLGKYSIPTESCFIATPYSGIAEIEVHSLEHPANNESLVKSKLEEAVFYSFLPGNPIDFSCNYLRSIKKPELERIIVDLGMDILNSRSTHLPPLFASLMQHLSCRLNSLNNLVRYIRSMSLDVDRQVLYKLRVMGEKCNSVRYLWNTIDTEFSTVSHSLIFQRIIYRLTQSASSDNALREWFLHNIESIDQLIAQAHEFCIDSGSRVQELPLEVLDVIMEANEVILAIQSSALAYRRESQKIYKLSIDTFGEEVPWTSTPETLVLLCRQFELTRSALVQSHQGTSDVENTFKIKDKGVLRNVVSNLEVQLVALTEVCFDAYSERIRWIEQRCGKDASEIQDVKEAFAVNRRFWVQTLSDIGKGSSAIRIAEKYSDYRSLVELCYQLYEDNELTDALNNYLDLFGIKFAFILYDYFVENGMALELLNSDRFNKSYLKQFFKSRDCNQISWMHDMRLGDYDAASHRLLQLATKQEKLVDKKESELSLSKLFLYAVPSNSGNIRDLVLVEQKLEQLHIQKMVSKSVMPVVERLRSQGKKYQLVEAVVDDLIGAKVAPVIARQVMQRVVKKFIAGQVVEATELLEYLSFSLYRREDLVEGEVTDYYLALRLLLTTRLTDDAKRFYENTIWRRAVLHDNWIQVLDTQGKNDAIIETQFRMSALYRTLEAVTINGLFHEGLIRPGSLSSCKFEGYDPQNLISIYPPARFGDVTEVTKVLNRESVKLDHYLTKTNLNTCYISMCLSCDTI
ncbi:Importin N-terminal domain-containing protein [Schizosaccharomyces pombe]